MKNSCCDRFWICMYCFNNIFQFATIKLLQTLKQNKDHYDKNSENNSTKTHPVIKLPNIYVTSSMQSLPGINKLACFMSLIYCSLSVQQNGNIRFGKCDFQIYINNHFTI